MSLFLIVAMYMLSKKAAISTFLENEKKEYVVVVDVGHGGVDPGKVGCHGILEKDINLEIALRIEKLLKQSDLKVILTRRRDEGLYDEDATNKKAQDMKRRIEQFEKCGADLVVSIHQNSFHDESVRGPQCFYYTASEEGKKAAQIVQDTLNEGLQIEKIRQSKANDSYYILKKSAIPTIIVECGFLSNQEDAMRLSDSTYQDFIAFQIYMGIQKYFNAF